MNRQILRLAIPNIISNITIPLLGLISTAIAGGLGSDAAIGAIGLGASIFNFLYWNCAFIRMGTSGMTAQAFGARDFRECANLLVRSMVVALSIAALLIVFQKPLGNGAIWLMRVGHAGENVRSMVAEYFFARIWAAPATVSLYAIMGWFIGMQNSKIPMYIAIAINLISILFSLLFVYKFGMGVAGIAYGTVVAQYSGLLIAAIFWLAYYRRFIKYVDMRASLRLKPMMRFFNVNKDIFLRTFFNVSVYTFFPLTSAVYGQTILATNNILIQLFTFYSYMSDGFGYAAEALTGKFIGAKSYATLRKSIIYMFWWCLGVAVCFTIIYALFSAKILGLFQASSAVLACAHEHIGWVIAVPLLGFTPFLMDSILIGATKTKILRDSMFISTIAFYVLYYSFVGTLGNNALWMSLTLFLVFRAVSQYLMSNRLEGLMWHKKG